MFRLDMPTKRGVVLNGVLFRPEEKRTADTVMVAITVAAADIYRDLFGIAPEDFYIKFDDITAWSVGSRYIDRSMFR